MISRLADGPGPARASPLRAAARARIDLDRLAANYRAMPRRGRPCP